MEIKDLSQPPAEVQQALQAAKTACLNWKPGIVVSDKPLILDSPASYACGLIQENPKAAMWEAFDAGLGLGIAASILFAFGIWPLIRILRSLYTDFREIRREKSL